VPHGDPAAAAVRLPPATPTLTPLPNWRIDDRHSAGIAAYAGTTSIAPGAPVTLYASTAAPRFRVRVLRMGRYGGTDAAQLWLSPWWPGRRQPPPVLEPRATQTVTTHWRPSARIPTTGWPAGDYLLRLEASDGAQTFVPLTVRAPSSAGRVVLLNAVTTWQAYNRWGCCDLYQGRDGGFATRSRIVSFDRPYGEEHGAGRFVLDELPVVAEAERLGLPLAYLTSVDLQRDPHVLDGARAVISMGHDEYWSPQMRAVLTKAVDAGTNLASLGANMMFRRIRFASSRLGADRLEINYKVAAEDPLEGRDDAQVTADWPAPPAQRPESALLGAQYGCLVGGTAGSGVVAAPRSWLFRGVAVRAGERLPGLMGPEVDAVQRWYPTPARIEVLLHSPVDCPARTPPAADTTYYVARSGAGVFDAGTMTWACAVGPSCHRAISGPTHPVVQAVTDNLLTTFAAGPAGRSPPPPHLRPMR
jgi:hypothetical protein